MAITPLPSLTCRRSYALRALQDEVRDVAKPLARRPGPVGCSALRRDGRRRHRLVGPQAAECAHTVHLRLWLAHQHRFSQFDGERADPGRSGARLGGLRLYPHLERPLASGFTALGLRKPRDGESASTINGVLYPVDGDDMSKFDAREEGYARVEIPHEDIEPVSWQSLPATGHIWVYVPAEASGQVPGVDLPEPDAAFPMLEILYRHRGRGRPGYWPGFRPRDRRDDGGLEPVLAE